MKKILMLFFFCLPILRGGDFLHAQDSLRLTISSIVSDANCGNKYTVTATTLGTVTQPITFMLDSTWSSTTGMFEKVSWGNHIIFARDAAGRKGFISFNLQGNNVPFAVYPYFTTSGCNNTTGTLKLNASGAQSFQYKLDNGVFQTDSIFRNVALGFHSYTVKNQAGCEYTGVLKATSTNTYNPYYSSYYDAVCGKNGNFRIYASNNYTYTLDNLAANGDSINLWKNVAPGNHILKVSDGTCVLETKTITLNAVGLQANFTPLVDSCNNAQSGYYRIDVNGGQAPFTYTLDSVKVSSNIVRLENNRTYSVLVKDATSCTYNGYFTPYYYEDLYVPTRFTSNSCIDSFGTLQLLGFYKSGQQFRPLSISFDGRPFSTDTVFKNVKLNPWGYVVKVKTKSGCEISTRLNFYPNYKLTDAFTEFSITNCTANTGTLTVYPDGGTKPYRYFINGEAATLDPSSGDSIAIIKNLKTGNYTLKIQSAEGCEITKQLVLKDKLVVYADYYSQNCGEAAQLRIQLNRSNISKSTMRLNNQLGQKDSSTNFTWQSILPGNYLLQLIDSSGCVRTDSIQLFSNGSTPTSTRLTTGCTDSTSLDYLITLPGGTAPFTFKNAYTGDTLKATNNVLKLKPQYYYITVTDSKNCQGSLSINAASTRDSFMVSANFTPNSCNDSIGTVKLSITDPNPNILRPLSISFNGRPFSPDSVIKNVGRGSNIYEVKIKSKQGCDMVSRVYNTQVPQLYAWYNNFYCANRFGRGRSGLSIYGGTTPYSYKWNGNGTFNPDDMPTGTYNITVTDAIGCTSSTSVSLNTCVWSGDTDTSGIVDHNDLLNIGLAYGERGAYRPCYGRQNDSCTIWAGQKGTEWSKQTVGKVNFKHIDTNGDGIINNADTVSIKRNWSKTRQLVGENVIVRSAGAPLFVQVNPVRENQWASLPIVLGDATTPANGVYGLAFSINYDPSVIDASTVTFTYNQTWLGTNSELLSISQNTSGRLDIGLTKINHSNSSGKGQIGTLNFKLKNGVGNKALNFSVSAPTLINSDAQVVPTTSQYTTTVVNGTEEPEWARKIAVYPNPTSGQFYIETQDIDIQAVKIYDISGKMIQQFQKLNNNAPLSILPSGTFFLSIETDKGVIKRKIVKF
jgi:hypothetical protein